MGSNTWTVSVTLMFKCVPVLSSKLSPQKPEIAAFDLELSFYFGFWDPAIVCLRRGKGRREKGKKKCAEFLVTLPSIYWPFMILHTVSIHSVLPVQMMPVYSCLFFQSLITPKHCWNSSVDTDIKQQYHTSHDSWMAKRGFRSAFGSSSLGSSPRPGPWGRLDPLSGSLLDLWTPLCSSRGSHRSTPPESSSQTTHSLLCGSEPVWAVQCMVACFVKKPNDENFLLKCEGLMIFFNLSGVFSLFVF